MTNCQAIDLDETVDDDIRKNYNSDKLVKEMGNSNNNNDNTLPQLPNILKQKSNNNYQPSKQPQTYYTNNFKQGNIKIKKGTTVEVVSKNAISDWQRAGTKISFSSVHFKNPLLSSRSTFLGEIIEVHKPQFSCNGGLIALRVYQININGNSYPVNAYITNANNKKIFFNNIKGDRTYLKTVYKKGKWGRSLFNKMFSLTVSLGKDGSTILLAPFPFLYGSVCFGANTIISPVTAFFCKGGHISIPAGSHYKIKFEDDAWIN